MPTPLTRLRADSPGRTLSTGGVGFAVASSYAAYPGPLYPPEAVLSPATLQENSPKLFTAGTNRTVTVQQSSDTGGVWKIESDPAYSEGQGAYATGNGAGVELVVYSASGCSVQFSGPAIASGGMFEIYLDGQFVAYGSCYAPQLTFITYHAALQVPAGSHTVTTAKVSGVVVFQDKTQVF